jgi:hypothetical protein
MATISENLQIIKDSTDAIKQAIIDKGGTIEGDITTWASAISGISGGGNNEDVEINNVYISLISTYAAIEAPGDETYTIFCSLEKPLDVPIQYFLISSGGDGEHTSNGSISAGTSEFEVQVTLNTFSSSIEKDFTITLCGVRYMGQIYRSKYTFKYNYL